MKSLGNHTSNRHWFFRYKLYHIPFWLLYNYLWWAVQSGSPLQTVANVFFSPYTVKFSFYVIFQAAAVYINLYLLIPAYLEKGKFVQYIVYLLLTILCAALLIVPGYYLSAFLSGRTYQQLYGGGSPDFFKIFIANPLPATVASSTLAMSIKLAKNWIQTKRRHQLLEKEKLETELKFLKYQFNPHFLFNTINSIFFLIHKNPDMASDSLAKFSDLLRYQLYECNDLQISLDKEVICLENSIELEKLRANKLEVAFQIDRQHIGHVGIAPFILMTFVENAFKHVSTHADRPNWISIKLRLVDRQLHFSVSNSVSEGGSEDVVRYGGIGLKNVQRRLDLIYPGQYDLAIQNSPESFEIRLRLELSELAVNPSLREYESGVI